MSKQSAPGIFYRRINKLAESSWPVDYGPKIGGTWKDHWMNCAKTIRDEFAAEGLINSANEMNRIVAEQERFRSL